MNSLSVAAIREADRRCIEELGVPGSVLMENAGRAIYAELPPGPVGIVCGKGNNGGDGYVVARLALLAGRDVRVVSLAPLDALAGDAATFAQVFARLGGKVRVADDGPSLIDAMRSLADRAVLVDAILGTGVNGEVKGLPRVAIEHWPKAYTVAVDIPSGLNADEGTAAGPAIRADVTVTIQFAKRGYDNPAAKPYLGRLVIADIGIPEVCADDAAWERLRASWS